MARNKYRAKKETVDGYTFDSRKEARRYVSLKMLQMAEEITDLTVHPKFVLQEGFIWHGKSVRPITYSADFMYHTNKPDTDYPNAYITVVEDVKGGKATQTRHFKDKVKMLKKKYPELDFRIVTEA